MRVRIGHELHAVASLNVRFRQLASGFGFIHGHGGANESLQRVFIDLVALVEIDGAPGVAFEAGIEEA